MEHFFSTFHLDETAGKISLLIFLILVIWAITKLLKLRLSPAIQDNEMRYRANKVMSFIGFLLVIILTVVIFSDKLSGLTIAFGVAGAGVAFALQEVIASFAGWLAIMFGGFYKTGDRVQLGGIKGDVIDVGVLRTTLMEIGQWVDSDLYNGRIVRIANSFVFKEPVFNYSGDFPFLWDEIKIPIMFGSPYEETRELFQSITNEVVLTHSSEAQKSWAHMVEIFMIDNIPTHSAVTLLVNDNWVEYTIRYVVRFRMRRATKNELFSRILAAVEATNGRIKFASSTVHLVAAPEIKVTLDSSRS
ncbi:MAG: mechanosensitive ion channel family protein [Burkholderiaceae bacterium]|nr:mechanosensitive ion channel family protein [Burkholderiaceae bacterium]